jgi:PilZ domain-containing protein
MERTISVGPERRAHPRRPRESTPWCASVLVRPGRAARLIDISDGGALIEIDTPLRPGIHVQVQLMVNDVRVTVAGSVMRCYVAAITADRVGYRGAIAFDAVPSEGALVAAAGHEYSIPTRSSGAAPVNVHALPGRSATRI